MKEFFRYSLPAWIMLMFGFIIPFLVAIIPKAKPGLGLILGVFFISFGLLALWAFYREWQELHIKRNSFTIKPFKERLARYKSHRLN